MVKKLNFLVFLMETRRRKRKFYQKKDVMSKKETYLIQNSKEAKMQKKLKGIFIFSLLLFFPCCGGSPKLEPTTKLVNVEINAAKLDVFDAASQVILKHGFSISNTNERLGLITTDFKQLEESIGGGVFRRLSGRRAVEAQLTINIVAKNNISILALMPKGRVQRKIGSYEEWGLSDSFLENIKKIGEEIKILAETKK